MRKDSTVSGLKGWIVIAAIAILAACPGIVRAAVQITASAGVDNREIYLGETLTLQIAVNGSGKPDQPDFSGLKDFEVGNLGGRQNSSSSITMINGRVTQNVSHGYIFVCGLTPKRAGILTIPPIKVSAEGAVAETPPIEVRVNKPGETDEFKLRIVLATNRCYVGEAVPVSFTFYFTRDLRGLAFQWPGLDPNLLDMDNAMIRQEPGASYYTLGFAGAEAIGIGGKASLDGRDYSTVTVNKTLIFKKAGAWESPPVGAICEVVTGRRQARSPFGDMMGEDFFNPFGGSRDITERKVVQSPAGIALEVMPLPAEGKPAGFKGHIGQFRIETRAAPLDVNVGDPITLFVKVGGYSSPARISLPPLYEQEALARDFKMPKEDPQSTVEDHGKTFTQTIRVKRSEVKEIPPIELPYFDPASGEYRIARSQPIPLRVRETRIVDVAEGHNAAGSKPEESAKGIAYNYEDKSVLHDQGDGLPDLIRSPVWIAIIGVPPFAWVVIFGVAVFVRRRRADPQGVRAGRAYREFRRRCRASGVGAGSCNALLDAVRVYLGDRLGVSGAALTFSDAAPLLVARGLEKPVLDKLQDVFAKCEAMTYAGNGASDAQAGLGGLVVEVISEIEEQLG